MMTDRELWVSVFNTALSSAMAISSQVKIDGKIVSATTWATAVANQALRDAPEDKP